MTTSTSASATPQDSFAADDLKPLLEALLLVATDPVSASALANIVKATPGEVASALAELSFEYKDQNRGFQLREVAGGWRLYTHPAYHDYVEAFVLSWDTKKLSQAALETIAVVAYHQPVTREQIRAVRGVNSDGVLSSLVDKGLVRELGRSSQAGQAILYGTTARTIRTRRSFQAVYPRAPKRTKHGKHAGRFGRGLNGRARPYRYGRRRPRFGRCHRCFR